MGVKSCLVRLEANLPPKPPRLRATFLWTSDAKNEAMAAAEELALESGREFFAIKLVPGLTAMSSTKHRLQRMEDAREVKAFRPAMSFTWASADDDAALETALKQAETEDRLIIVRRIWPPYRPSEAHVITERDNDCSPRLAF